MEGGKDGMRKQKLGMAGLVLIILGLLAGCAKSAAETAVSGGKAVGEPSPETDRKSVV